ncbi:MAG: transcriptional repressor [bacterium]|nr:transcriptional repressor [bacterium]
MMQENKAHRNTQQRAIILEELNKLKSHPTASELYEIVRKRLPKISLGTVYRNLEFLTEAGIIQRLELSGSESRFDGTAYRHNHIHCMLCGRVDDLMGLPDDPVVKRPKIIDGYRVAGYHLEFYGTCPACLEIEPGH